MSFAAIQRDLETDTQSEVIKSHREAETQYDIPYMWNLKRNDIDRNELTKQKKIHRFRDRT